MGRMVSRFLGVVMTLGWTAVASAQALPLFEVGAGFGGLVAVEYGAWLGDFRVTVPCTPRFSLEGLLTVGLDNFEYASGMEGLYIVQVKQRLPTRGRFHAFLTYGAAGYYAHVRQEERDVPVPNGQPFHSKGYSYNRVSPPIWVVIGGGLQRTLARRLAIRADAQLATFLSLPAAVRLSGGVSIPFGGYSPK